MTVHPRPLGAALLALAVILAACGGTASAPDASQATSPATSPAPSTTTGPDPTPVPVPSASDAGGGAPGDPGGGGVVEPAPGGVGDPGGGPALVTPVAGLTGIHPVPASSLAATVTGRRVVVRVSWTSGVEPCYALAGVDVTRDGSAFLLTIAEGSGAGPDTMCIEIAQLKATDVDLGELEPGTYDVAAFGDAAPVEVVVAG
jgi:hypothetical protein